MDLVREKKVKAEGELLMVQNDEGVWEEYDPTWDITIHCTSEKEMNAVQRMLQEMSKDVRYKKPCYQCDYEFTEKCPSCLKYQEWAENC